MKMVAPQPVREHSRRTGNFGRREMIDRCFIFFCGVFVVSFCGSVFVFFVFKGRPCCASRNARTTVILKPGTLGTALSAAKVAACCVICETVSHHLLSAVDAACAAACFSR
tara:strand:- start:422 stop:754 length:333 start_codon:yes stop_codon:yes gene_type:complete